MDWLDKFEETWHKQGIAWTRAEDIAWLISLAGAAEKYKAALEAIVAMDTDDYDHGMIMDPDGYLGIGMCAGIARTALGGKGDE